MKRAFAAISTALALAVSALPASANTVDPSAFACSELTEAMASDDKEAQYGGSAILYWLHGYLATEEQGTVVDLDNMTKSMEKTAEYCTKNPAIGVMTAAEKFMGENTGEPGKGAMDLKVITCEYVINTKEKDYDGLGQIMMWLAGYHASYNQDTVIDLAKYEQDSTKLGEYCAKNQQVGFFTASEKIMGSSVE